MLEVNGLVKTYGDKKVVDGVSFGVPRGTMLALLGESGCGKTTTLKMINRLIEPSAGEVLIEGRPVTAGDPVLLRRSIGYVIQENGLFPHYTVAENVAVVPRLNGYDEGKIETAVNDVLEQVELDPALFAHKYPAELSGGQQQRVAIARAIVTRPPLLLMDEPFSALDPITRGEAQQRFQRLIRQFEIAVVLVTHDLAEAIQLSDRICLMKDGRIVQEGDARQLLFQPNDAFAASFFQQHRFEAELKVTTLGDLLPMLQPDPDAAGAGDQIATDTDLYTLLSGHSTDASMPFILLDETQRPLGRVSISHIVQAFYAYRAGQTPGGEA
ncbi:MAG: ABC transporter ATP-binding protein [Lewinellaceae bacterium]|nr:ABC transporter ATP-binding protein [Lewinellaceae bacterium]